MASEKCYVQCLLQRGDSRKVSWLPLTQVKVGRFVELLPDRLFWEVLEIYRSFTLTEAALRMLQDSNRHSLPSIEAIA